MYNHLCKIHTTYKLKTKTGKGFSNTASLSFEVHVPGYKFCGEEIKLEKKLAYGDKDINPLHSAYWDYDIVYLKINDLKYKHI